jgi:hypothetical protein
MAYHQPAARASSVLDFILYISASVCAVGCLGLWVLREPPVSYPRVEWDDDVIG